jgi:cytochrome P450
VSYASRYVLEQVNSLFLTPSFFPTPGNLKFKAAIKTLDEVVFDVIEQRRQGQTKGNDLLDLLLEARDEETGEGMTPQQVRDELMTFYLAGHETTSNTLAWTLYLLGTNPGAEAQLKEELSRVLGNRLPTLEDTRGLTYCTQVLEEAMRLYPPGWFIGRTATEEDEVGGYHVSPGTQVCFSAYVTHRDPRFFEKPDAFDPSHFSPEATKSRPVYAYYPFSGGTRKCIGAGFAMLEMQLILATLLQSVRLSVEPGFKAEPYPAVTLVPKNGIRVMASFA